jgi:hypothetical protein
VAADETCCAEALCALGADVTIQDNDGNSAWKLMVISMPLVVQKVKMCLLSEQAKITWKFGCIFDIYQITKLIS